MASRIRHSARLDHEEARGPINAHIRAASAITFTIALGLLTACDGSPGTTSPPTPTVLPQARLAPPCPPDAHDPLTVASAHRSTWSACANDAGTVMYVYNISQAALLASPYPLATLHREMTPLSLSSGHATALATLSALTNPQPDPQANGQVARARAGWVYVAPQSYVRVTSPVWSTTGAYLAIDYYATVQYTMARALGDYLVGKVTPRPLALRNSVLSCGQQINVTVKMENDPPPPVNIVQNIIRAGSACYDAIKSLDPDAPEPSVLADDVAGEAKGFAKGLLLKLPAEEWEEGFRLLGQLAHDR